MKLARKIALTLVTGALGFGLVGLSAPSAHADTSWGCGGCRASVQR